MSNLIARFNNNFIVSISGCWLWTGFKSTTGYGVLQVDGKKIKAHRISYEIYKKQIPQGMSVLHKCDVRECVNPDHLFIGTHQDNMKDMVEKRRSRNGNKCKTHCKRGHIFSEENTYFTKSATRVCRECEKLRDAKRRIVKKLTAKQALG